MAVPRGLVVTCPGCDVPLEMETCAWSVVIAESEDKGKGVVVETAAWASHECGKGKQ